MFHLRSYSNFILKIVVIDRFNPHFTDKEAEGQKSQ